MKNLLYIGNKLKNHGYTPSSADLLPQLLESIGFKVIAVSSKKNKVLRLWDMALTIFKERKNTDAILIDTYSTQNFYYAVVCVKLASLLKIPYMPILHGGNLEKRLLNSPKLSNELFSNAKVNVAPSVFLKAIFKTKGFHNVVHVPNSISIEDYQFKPRKLDVPKLLWVRSFSEIYNPMLALKLFQILRQRCPTAQLCMVGPDKDGSLGLCKSYAEANNLPVLFPGKLEKAAWRKLSEAYNIFINTTNYDNMPVSVIEAMALGLPVISTNVGGIPFLIEDNKTGFLVEPNSEKAFLKTITEIMEQPHKADLISQRARTMVEEFGWDKVKLKWLKLLS